MKPLFFLERRFFYGNRELLFSNPILLYYNYLKYYGLNDYILLLSRCPQKQNTTNGYLCPFDCIFSVPSVKMFHLFLFKEIGFKTYRFMDYKLIIKERCEK
ncbi:MAG TPA: hypothetical protein DDW34_00825 [Clostridium sp.]|nr:hypothetical protein [Clostridium sp.]